MLVDTSLTIAYKCPFCGTFDFLNISLFRILRTKEHHLICRCKGSCIAIFEENAGDYKIKIPCIGCGDEHIFMVDRKQLVEKDLNILFCPEKGMQLCFIGRDHVVRKKVDSIEKELDELIDDFGYDNYFKNTRVMFDSLNRIHDLAERGNLNCECGSADIELIMLSDRIYLKCRKCPGSKIIFAASNEDLKIMQMMQYLLLTGEETYVIKNGMTILRKK